MAETAEGAAAPGPDGAVLGNGGHVAVADGAVHDGEAIEGIFHFARKDLVGAVARVAVAELVAVALTEGPQHAALRNGSGR